MAVEEEITGVPSGGLLRRNPDFARLYIAAMVSFAGDWFTSVALLGLILQTTHRPALAGLILAMHTLPYALVSPFAGVVADRVDRKKLMIAADLTRAVVALGLLLVGPSTIWIAFACTGLLSAISPFFEPASNAALPNLVGTQDLVRANVLMGSAWGTMLAVGAALGGLVAATLGRNAAFLIDSASFLISGALIATIGGRFRERPREAHHVTIAQDIREGAAFARREPRVLALLVGKLGSGVAGGTIALLSIFAVRVFHRGDAGIGILMGARGVGALIGPFLWRRFVFRGRDSLLFLSIGLAFIVFGVSYALFSQAPNIWLAALAVVGAHLGGGANWALGTYGLQRFTPDAVRGRVFSFDYALITLSMAASFSVAGALSGVMNPRVVALGFACLALIWAVSWTAWTHRLIARNAAGSVALD